MKIADVFLTAQSTSALGIAQHLLGSKDAVTRVSPVIGERFRLDDVSARPRLRGLGRSEARLLLPHLRASFFYEPGADEFFPCHHE
jgi:hypothetical protein